MDGLAQMNKKLPKILLAIIPFILCSGFADASNFKTPLHLKWVTKLKKEDAVTKRPFQLASPLVEDGIVYIGSAGGYFYALDSKKGAKRWQIKLSGGIYSDPAIAGDSVYIADRKGNVYSISKDTGKIKWQIETGAEISARPIAVDNTVYVVTVLRQLIAIDVDSGGKKWNTLKEGLLPPMTIKGSSDPVFFNGQIYVGYADGTLVNYRAKDGAVSWKVQLSDRNSRFQDVDAAPFISGDTIYISTVDNQTYALSLKDGHILWHIEKGGANDLALDGSRLYIAGSGVLTSVIAETGQVVWEQDFEEPEISAPAVKDGLAVVMSTNDKLYVVDAATGELKYRRYLGKGSFGKPVISEGTLYILTNSSRMFALQ